MSQADSLIKIEIKNSWRLANKRSKLIRLQDQLKASGIKVRSDSLAHFIYKGSLFDRKIRENKQKALKQIGAIVRKVEHDAIKKRSLYRSKPSLPGEIPKSPTGRLRNKISYNVIGEEAVVIGPSYQYPRTSTPGDINTKPVTVVKRRLVEVKAADPENRSKLRNTINGQIRLVKKSLTKDRGVRKQLTDKQEEKMIEKKKKKGRLDKRRFVTPELSGKELFKKKVYVRVERRPYTGPVLSKSIEPVMRLVKTRLLR